MMNLPQYICAFLAIVSISYALITVCMCDVSSKFVIDGTLQDPAAYPAFERGTWNSGHSVKRWLFCWQRANVSPWRWRYLPMLVKHVGWWTLWVGIIPLRIDIPVKPTLRDAFDLGWEACRRALFNPDSPIPLATPTVTPHVLEPAGVPCKVCSGAGYASYEDSEAFKCPSCRGTGRKSGPLQDAPEDMYWAWDNDGFQLKSLPPLR